VVLVAESNDLAEKWVSFGKKIPAGCPWWSETIGLTIVIIY
jgi:hypothetical protein